MDYRNKYLKYKQKYIQLKLKSKFKLQTAGTILPIPKVGLGTWQSSSNDREIERIVLDALKLGYRCFDCALNYGNEEGIGIAFKYAFENMGIKRDELFIIGKANSYDDIQYSLTKLNLEYFDLALIHLKFIVSNDVWLDFIKLKSDGKAINIGLSNIYLSGLTQFNDWCDKNHLIKPSAIENEINIFNPEPEFVDYCNSNDIKVIAYTPLVQMSNTKSMFEDNEILNRIKDKYGLTLAQLLLLWGIRRNITVIPGSSNPVHMCENLAVMNYVDNPSILDIDEIDSITKSIGYNIPVIETANLAKEHELQ